MMDQKCTHVYIIERKSSTARGLSAVGGYEGSLG